MKVILRSAVIAAMIIATSCGKDDSDNVAEQREQEAKEQEQTPLEANSMSDNVIIAGSTKEEGVSPTPNEAITMDASLTGKTALLNEGFDIVVNSDAEITGAYVQFKANDGTVSDSYYDVDIKANKEAGQSGKAAKGLKSKSQKVNSLFAKNDQKFEIDVDFNANVEPGTFCYVVCVYDAEGNISAPSEVCATVESWGGNAALVAEWDFVKSEYLYNGETEVTTVGVEECDTFNLSCFDMDEPIEITTCETSSNAELNLKSDGTYTFTIQYDGIDYDYDATIESCTAVYEDEGREVYSSEGFWAYAEAESRFTLVEYEWSETENGELSDSETYAEGDAYLLFDGKISIDGNKFNITEEYQYSNISEVYTSYFEK